MPDYSNTIRNLHAKLARQKQNILFTEEQIAALEQLTLQELDKPLWNDHSPKKTDPKK